MFKLTLVIISIIINCINGMVYEKCINDNDISMTFDDGPTNNTMGIMEILNKNNISGIFFINGYYVKKNNFSGLIKKMYKDGHIIGSHTYSHPALTTLNDFNIERELYDNELVMREIINMRPLLFRPPYFAYDDRIIEIVDKFGYIIVAANMNSLDWKTKNSTQILNEYKSKLVYPGSYISLNHDNVSENLDVLQEVIDYIKFKKFNIVSMKKCLGIDNLYVEDNYYGPNLLM